MSAHTPGPWKAISNGNGYDIFDPRGYDVVTVYGGGVGWEDREANARLIAAAPDMLESLKAAVDCGLVPVSSAKEGGANAHARQVHVADQIRAAIAKATGAA